MMRSVLPILKKGFGIAGRISDHTEFNRSTSIGMCTCTICGGSGIQRISSQRFRTCFTCLGQGQISAAIHSAPLNQLTTTELTLNQLSYLTRQPS